MYRKSSICIMLLFICVSCQKSANDTAEKVNQNETKKVVILETGNIKVGQKDNNVIVYRYFGKPNAAGNKENIYIEGPVKGEMVEIDIIGSVKKIEHVSLYWDGEKIIEKEILHSYKNIRDKKIFLDTYFTEGPPNDMIRVIDVQNKKHVIEFNEKDLR